MPKRFIEVPLVMVSVPEVKPPDHVPEELVVLEEPLSLNDLDLPSK